MKDKQDLIEGDPRHNIFTLLIIILVFGGIGVVSFVAIINQIIHLFLEVVRK